MEMKYQSCPVYSDRHSLKCDLQTISSIYCRLDTIWGGISIIPMKIYKPNEYISYE